MFCNNGVQNRQRNVSRNGTVCLYMLSTTTISIIVFVVALSYNKSLVRLGDLETDVKEILVLSQMNSRYQGKNKEMDGSNANPKTSSISSTPSKSVGCNEKSTQTLIEETVKKHTENLNKEIMATKKQIDALKDVYKCGKNLEQKPIAPINYAQESLGAKIEYVKDIPYYTDNPILTYMGFHFSNSPRQILCASTSPGNCYAFRGTESIVIINLMRNVHIESIAIEHILDTMTPSGDISNAPKEFEGLLTSCSKDKEIFLGKFTYNIHSREAIQYFSTIPDTQNYCFPFVEFKFLTNNGQINYTCVYRVGVHGRLGKNTEINEN